MDVLEIVNMHRASGYNCGSGGSFGPAAALTMQPNLRCAARVHSKDMDTRNFFAHDNPSGESPFDRMGMAEYSYSTAGENIAAGSADAVGTMNQWMNSSGHCVNIMNPSFTEIGVGYHPGGQYGTLWTQTFGG
ncbi:MAG: CAP domain-containing protein [Nannocystaceae bacterium]|nr:CAP domain-containing protein [Nannocystaceae bacterium]